MEHFLLYYVLPSITFIAVMQFIMLMVISHWLQRAHKRALLLSSKITDLSIMLDAMFKNHRDIPHD